MWHTHRTEENYEDYSNITGQFADACDMIQNMVSDNIDDERVRKGTKHFVKKVLNAKKLETMIGLLHGIGKSQKVWQKAQSSKTDPCPNYCKSKKIES